jgi:molybdopterin synthase catalytic subunit
MTIHVLFFALLRDRAGTARCDLTLPENATVADAAEAIGERFPGLLQAVSRVAYAVNRDYASPTTSLHDGDELALIPPVSGGSV